MSWQGHAPRGSRHTERMKAAPWLPPLLAGLLVLGLLSLLLLPGSPDRDPTAVGRTPPNFALQSLDGETVELAALRGRPVVLNFWASWCLPCREEAPLLRELQARSGVQGGNVQVLGILYSDREDAARRFVAEYALNYPSLLDPGSRVALDYRVAGVPETLFLDAQGVVRSRVRGSFTEEELRGYLDSIGVSLPLAAR